MLRRRGRGIRVQGEGVSFALPAVAHSPRLVPGYGGTRVMEERGLVPRAVAGGAGRGCPWDEEPGEGRGPWRKRGSHERGQL